ncbi:MAG TPA: hypothetical protein VFW49_04270 [Fluviicoccus sp.]|nr:hypothetical protein [Fluviicoccus sp.]
MPFRWQALGKYRQDAPWLVLDFFVLLLITLNLLWLVIDSLLLNSGAGILIHWLRPDIVPTYRAEWHRNALLYDTLLTGFLIVELLIRWVVAAYRKAYHRWFFYPFIHWYDVLGCLPGLQALRLLRLISIFYRLNRMGLLLVGTGLIDTVKKYYGIVLEEISDRIVVNVLDGVQREIRSGNPVSGQIRERILDPHREVLTGWISGQLTQVAAHSYQSHEQALAAYLEEVAAEAIRQNPEWRALKGRLPLVGGLLELEIQTMTGSLVNGMASRLIRDLGKPGNRALDIVSEALYDNMTRPDPQVTQAVEQIALEAIDLIKSQVTVQQWKREEDSANS